MHYMRIIAKWIRLRRKKKIHHISSIEWKTYSAVFVSNTANIETNFDASKMKVLLRKSTEIQSVWRREKKRRINTSQCVHWLRGIRLSFYYSLTAWFLPNLNIILYRRAAKNESTLPRDVACAWINPPDVYMYLKGMFRLASDTNRD